MSKDILAIVLKMCDPRNQKFAMAAGKCELVKKRSMADKICRLEISSQIEALEKEIEEKEQTILQMEARIEQLQTPCSSQGQKRSNEDRYYFRASTKKQKTKN